MTAIRKFWNWIRSESGGRSLYLDGPISNEPWIGDEVTPAIFKEELDAASDDITVWINSPGGCVFAGARIYNMLKEYSGRITVKVDGIAASIASVIAMAGDEVLMSPVSTLVVHNPETIAFGDETDMIRAKDMLAEVKGAIVNAYELKTKLSRVRISHLMDSESWMNVKTAMELGFADGMLYNEDEARSGEVPVFNSVLFSRRTAANGLLRMLPPTQEPSLSQAKNQNMSAEKPVGVQIKPLYERLFTLNNQQEVFK